VGENPASGTSDYGLEDGQRMGWPLRQLVIIWLRSSWMKSKNSAASAGRRLRQRRDDVERQLRGSGALLG